MKNPPIWLLAAALAALAPLAIVTFGCDTSSTPASPDFETPIGSTWELTTVETSSGVAVVPDPARYTLELRDDGRAHVVADCNVCNGPYEIGEETLELGLMACTLAACPSGSLFDEYVSALGSVTSWQSTDGELLLTHADGALRFR